MSARPRKKRGPQPVTTGGGRKHASDPSGYHRDDPRRTNAAILYCHRRTARRRGTAACAKRQLGGLQLPAAAMGDKRSQACALEGDFFAPPAPASSRFFDLHSNLTAGTLSVMQKPSLAGMERDSTGKPPPQYPIESVDNALRLLLLLGERSEIRLTDASEYLRVASSTAHRLLSMLQYRGFVRQDPASKAYQPGPSLTNVAFAVHSRMDIPRTAAPPILRQLVDTLQETVHVGTLDGRLVRFIAALESPSAVRVISRLGSTRPAHCTSTGKVLLAGLSDDELDQLYPPDPHLEPLTEHSVRTLTELRAQLAEVRKKRVRDQQAGK